MKNTKPSPSSVAEPLLFNEVKISYTSKKQLGPAIISSRDAYDFMLPYWEDLDYCESFYVLLLSRGNKVMGACRISVGSVAGTVADPKKIFQTALAANSSAIIIMHNHPSGETKPSHNDNMVTRKCVEVGRFLELPVLDHIIVTKERYYSFADEGMI